MNPKVSIVTNAHNYGRFLTDCILSVLSQTYPSVEHVIVNSGSTDNTADIAKGYRNSVVRYFEIEDQGLSGSKNYGIEHARGEYIICLDADDKLHPRAVEKMAACASEKVLVCPGLQEFDGGSGYGWNPGPYTLNDFLRGNRIFCASMFSRKGWEEVGGYDRGLDWLGYEDWEFWIRMVKNGCSVRVVHEILFYHRGSCITGHSTSSTSRTIATHEQRMKYLFEKHGVTA